MIIDFVSLPLQNTDMTALRLSEMQLRVLLVLVGLRVYKPEFIVLMFLC
jgi:hypothetical protein